jgi:hypothetical protein
MSLNERDRAAAAAYLAPPPEYRPVLRLQLANPTPVGVVQRARDTAAITTYHIALPRISPA